MARAERILIAAVGAAGLASVASLLAWVFGLGKFSTWFWVLSAPVLAATVVVALIAARSPAYPRLHTVLVVGAIGGLVGTVGYDLFRVPFTWFGLQLFAPIDSYGVLLLDAESSSRWTGLAGWAFHFANGIGFGIFYAAIARGRRWWWGVAWAMVLETATVLTPFAGTYGLSGKWGIIAIAYAAHVAYGAPLGYLVEHPTRTLDQLREIGTRAASVTLLVGVVVLFVWHRPFATSSSVRTGESVAPGPSAVVRNGRLSPAWLRVAPGACASIRNDDRAPVALQGAIGRPVLRPAVVQEVCFTEAGVHRLQIPGRAYSGGFVIVDEELA